MLENVMKKWRFLILCTGQTLANFQKSGNLLKTCITDVRRATHVEREIVYYSKTKNKTNKKTKQNKTFRSVCTKELDPD